MSLLPHDASFHERVQDLFAAFRGRGVSLSPLDVELLDSWAKTGAPFEVVARGIRQAAESALFDATQDDRGLRSLIACQRKVESELKKFVSSTAGRATPQKRPRKPVPLHLKRHRKLKGALKKAAKHDPRLDATVKRLLAVRAPNDFDEAQALEDLACAALLRALPWHARHGLLQEARQLVQRSPAMSNRARRESRRLHRAALLRRTLSLPAFW